MSEAEEEIIVLDFNNKIDLDNDDKPLPHHYWYKDAIGISIDMEEDDPEYYNGESWTTQVMKQRAYILLPENRVMFLKDTILASARLFEFLIMDESNQWEFHAPVDRQPQGAG
jgi:hypothetical protein